jgi:hypothetical protein
MYRISLRRGSVEKRQRGRQLNVDEGDLLAYVLGAQRVG